MKSFQITYNPFELKFKKLFITSKKEIDKREGFIIKISDGKQSGLGECAPFPEFGSETYVDARNKLSNFKLKLNLEPTEFKGNLHNSLKGLDNFPSLKQGIEQALFNLICKQTNLSLNELLNVSSSKEIYVNAVIGFLSPKESVETCSKFLKDGYETIKIKVGRNNSEDDVKVIKSIRDELGHDFKIRID